VVAAAAAAASIEDLPPTSLQHRKSRKISNRKSTLQTSVPKWKDDGNAMRRYERPMYTVLT
jgi:hypothetical protein